MFDYYNTHTMIYITSSSQNKNKVTFLSVSLQNHLHYCKVLETLALINYKE
jgi:hypothetical protein